MRWLLCDYGEVLTLAPSAAARAALETEADAESGGFWAAYWQHRPAYDRGDLDTVGYWTKVIGRPPHRPNLRRLVGLDVIMWSQPNPASLAAAGRVAERGTKLAVLSNAPAELADHFDQLPWLAPFEPRLFSGRLGTIKPEPAIYAVALEALAAKPRDVLFIDDRPENVRSARRAGLRSIQFTDPSQIDRAFR
jgi:putative hydrolase of the HAD superfamily